jgi:ribose transport system ATP-binding protein
VKKLDKNCILKVEGISKTFPGTKALSAVKIEVMEGEVHAVVGENGAGKSTLMNIISGVFQPDEGRIFFLNNQVKFANPSEAQAAGIGFVHQELALCQHISVAENIYMGRFDKGCLGIIKKKKLFADTIELLKMFNVNIKPDEKIGNLNVAEQQIVEIAKSLSLRCRLLILDEPTSSLSESETNILFNIIRNLKEQGIGVLYISHRIVEIFEVCDRVTIFRDGHYINTFNVPETTPRQVVECMVGRELNHLYPEKSADAEENLLEVRNLTKKGVFTDISFAIRKGEILGFSGLIGSGRTEVARAVCAIDRFDSGEIYILEKKTNFKNYQDAIKKGLCYLTEDRKQQGLFLNLSVKDNINVTMLEEISKRLIISSGKETENAMAYIQKLGIKVSAVSQQINSLSGGNQQKAMIAKWLSIHPKIIFMDEPTRGIDVGAKAEIHEMLRQLSNSGIGVVIISSELPEIIGMCDRVIVMQEGSIKGEVKGTEISEKKIIMLASGQ